MHQIIKSDLESFGEYEVLPPENMLSLPTDQTEVFFRDWRILAVDFLVIGQLNKSEKNDELDASYLIFDVVRERTIH